MDINIVSGPKAHREFISHRLEEPEARALEGTGLDLGSIYAAGVILMSPDESIRLLATLSGWFRDLDRSPKGADKGQRKEWRAKLALRHEVRDLMDRLWGLTRVKHALESAGEESDGLPTHWNRRMCGQARRAMLKHRFLLSPPK